MEKTVGYLRFTDLRGSWSVNVKFIEVYERKLLEWNEMQIPN